MENNPNRPPSLLNVYIHIPGLHVEGEDAFRFASLVAAPIEAALACAGLLASRIPDAHIKQTAFDAAVVLGKLVKAIEFEADSLLTGLVIDTAAACKIKSEAASIGIFGLDAIRRVCEGKSYSCADPANGRKFSAITAFAQGSWCLLALEVSDLVNAGSILFVELDRLGLLQSAEIAAFDPLLNILRKVYPPACDKPFERHWLLFAQTCAGQMDKMRAILTQCPSSDPQTT